KSTTRRETPHVRLKRLSVAVVVDSGAPDATLPDAQLASYSRLVAKAVGLDPDRGDAIEVVGMGFSGIETLEAGVGATEPPSSVEVLMEDPVIRYGLLGALSLLALATGFAYWRRRRAVALQEAKEKADRAQREKMEAELLELKSGNRAADEVQAQVEILRQKAVIQSETDIHRTAAVIREWMQPPAVEGAGA
ncbi:MAG: flagellar M-ring protein FliF C-terminal domain-containing protein, partial [Myxococcota bacterium]|nr:flagellar M-ring protein FliF C-terminal domain-containing protein [Myxococcota bacterium]